MSHPLWHPTLWQILPRARRIVATSRSTGFKPGSSFTVMRLGSKASIAHQGAAGRQRTCHTVPPPERCQQLAYLMHRLCSSSSSVGIPRAAALLPTKKLGAWQPCDTAAITDCVSRCLSYSMVRPALMAMAFKSSCSPCLSAAGHRGFSCWHKLTCGRPFVPFSRRGSRYLVASEIIPIITSWS